MRRFLFKPLVGGGHLERGFLRRPCLRPFLRISSEIHGSAFRHNGDNKDTKISDTKLSNDIFNVPNCLTMARIVATPGISWLILNDYYAPAVGAFWIAGFLDWLDGYFARKLNQRSIFGSFLDPLADKLFVGTSLITMCYIDLIPWQIGVIIVGRDIILVGGSFIARAVTKPKEARFFEMGAAAGVVSVEPSMISKFNTLAQFGLLWFTLTAHAWSLPPVDYLPFLWYTVGGTTILSGADYLFRSNYRAIFTSRGK